MLIQSISVAGVSLPPGLVVNALVGATIPFDPGDISTLRWYSFRQASVALPSAWSGMSSSETKAVQPPHAQFFLKLNGTFLTTPLVSAPGLAARTPLGLAYAYSAYSRNAWVGPRFTISSSVLHPNLSPWVRSVGDSQLDAPRVAQGIPDIRSDQPYILVNAPKFSGIIEVHNTSQETAPYMSDWLTPVFTEETLSPGAAADLRYLYAPLDYFAHEVTALHGTQVLHRPVFNVAQIEEEFRFSASGHAMPISAIAAAGSASRSTALVGYADVDRDERTVLAQIDPNVWSAEERPVTFFAANHVVPQPIYGDFQTLSGDRATLGCHPAVLLSTSPVVLVGSGLQFKGKLPGLFAWSKNYSSGGPEPSLSTYGTYMAKVQAAANCIGTHSAVMSPAWVGLDRWKSQVVSAPDQYETVADSVPLVDEREWLFACSSLDIVSASSIPSDLPDFLRKESLLNRASQIGLVYHSISGSPSGEMF